jgi:hypothetical protein
MESTWRDDDGAFLFLPLPTYCAVISFLLVTALRMKYFVQYHHYHAQANELVARLVTVSVKVIPSAYSIDSYARSAILRYKIISLQHRAGRRKLPHGFILSA